MATPVLPANASCKTAAPCLVVLKNSAYNDYVVNWLIVISAADAGAVKETFVNGANKGFQADITSGIATAMVIGDKTIYKYENNSDQIPKTIAGFIKNMGFDPALQQTMYVATSSDSIIMIFFQKPPAGAPGIYTNYLNISSLIIP